MTVPTLNILISFQDRRPCEQVAWVARRAIEHALDRFAQRIRDVTVKIRDENAQKGGIDQHCSLSLRVHGGREFHLHDIDSSPQNALHRLAARAARLVKATTRRRRGGRR